MDAMIGIFVQGLKRSTDIAHRHRELPEIYTTRLKIRLAKSYASPINTTVYPDPPLVSVPIIH